MSYKVMLAYVCTFMFYFANGDDFKSVNVWSRIELYTIRRDVNSSIAMTAFSAQSSAYCSTRCTALFGVSFYFLVETRMCQCNNDVDVSTMDDPDKPEVVYGQLAYITEILQYKEFTKWNVIPRKEDCLALHKAGFSQDGVYTIQPTGQEPVDTWCDMQNGGWTVFQRRLDGSEDFYRGWSDYVTGFGNRTGEYWLGLDNLHVLTTQPSELHVYMEAFEGKLPQSAFAHYSTFTVHGPSLNYRLNVGGFNGSCGSMFPNSLTGNNMPFSTLDRDHDSKSYFNCAELHHGAWWYGGCHVSNLNGLYHGGFHSSYADGINFKFCWGYYYSVKETVMKLMRAP